MLSPGIKYSMRDLSCDVNYCARGAKLRHASQRKWCQRSFFIILPSSAVNFIPGPF